ncbi:MAG: PDZ domain-containing protein, partial [Acidobacteriota bacterium]
MIFKPRTRKLIVLGLTAALVVASLLVLRSGLERWQRDGWVGLAFFSLSMAKGDSGAGQLLTSLVTVEKQGEVFLIHPDSPASRSGIHVGDRILSINGVDVGDPEGLNDLDRTLRRGESVVYVYDQGGVQRRVDVVLESPLASPPHVAGVVIAFLVGWIYLGISLLV